MGQNIGFTHCADVRVKLRNMLPSNALNYDKCHMKSALMINADRITAITIFDD